MVLLFYGERPAAIVQGIVAFFAHFLQMFAVHRYRVIGQTTIFVEQEAIGVFIAAESGICGIRISPRALRVESI